MSSSNSTIGGTRLTFSKCALISCRQNVHNQVSSAASPRYEESFRTAPQSAACTTSSATCASFPTRGIANRNSGGNCDSKNSPNAASSPRTKRATRKRSGCSVIHRVRGGRRTKSFAIIFAKAIFGVEHRVPSATPTQAQDSKLWHLLPQYNGVKIAMIAGVLAAKIRRNHLTVRCAEHGILQPK